MDLRQDLIDRFHYDLWANKKWWAALGRFRDLSKPQEVLDHILAAQRIWLSRIGVEVSQGGEDLGIDDLMALVNRAWQMVLGDGNLEQPITYRNLQGQEYSNTIGEIASHVINHGTYHRGHLRGLAQAENLDGFPETDLIGYYRERAGETKH